MCEMHGTQAAHLFRIQMQVMTIAVKSIARIVATKIAAKIFLLRWEGGDSGVMGDGNVEGHVTSDGRQSVWPIGLTSKRSVEFVLKIDENAITTISIEGGLA